MSERPRVLIVEDQVGDLHWLLDLIKNRGYDVVLATNEEAAEERLRAVEAGTETYALAVIDVMLPVKDLTQIVEMEEMGNQFYEDSRNSGIRLCQLARRTLAIPAEQLPVVCLTAREDDKVHNSMRDLGIPIFSRAAPSNAESIRRFVEERLPMVGA